MQKYVDYYTNSEGRQLGDLINELPFALASTIKYIWRYDKKGTPEKDLQKALHYVKELFDYPYQHKGMVYWNDFAYDRNATKLFCDCMDLLRQFVNLAPYNDLALTKEEIKILIQKECFWFQPSMEFPNGNNKNTF